MVSILKIRIIIIVLFLWAPFSQANVKYFYHWSSENRHQMLIGFKNFRKAVEDSVFGIGSQGNLSSFMVAGRGLYLANDAYTSKPYGTHLTIVAVPDSSQIKQYDKSQDYYVVNSSNSEIRFYRIDDFISILEKGEFKSLIFKQIVALLQVLEKLNRSDLIIKLENLFIVHHSFSLQEYFQKIQSRFIKFKMLNYEVSPTDANFSSLSKNTILALQLIDREHMEITMRNNFSKLRPGSDRDYIETLPSVYQHITSFHSPQNQKAIWYNSKIEKLISTDVYGSTAFEAWKDASRYVYHKAPENPLSFDDLVQIHQKVYPASVGDFKSYLEFEIQKFSNRDKREAIDMLKRGQFSEIYSKFNLARPSGVIRSGPIYIRSSSQNLDGTRQKFSLQELMTLSKSPHMTVNLDSGTVRFNYYPGFKESVKELVEAAANKAQSLKNEYMIKRYLNKEASLEYFNRATELAADFYAELSERHVFWDGSGRTAKLARDWLLLQMGFSPPLSTPQNDLTMPKNELLADLRLEIQKSASLKLSFRLFDIHELLEESTQGSRLYPNKNKTTCEPIFK